MTDLPAPRAARLQRPGWRDARLLGGVILVLASVALGALVVSHADDRLPVYAARIPLVPGQRLSQDDLTRVEVQLGSHLPSYLSAAQDLGPDRFVLRPVPAGELVPTRAVGSTAEVGVQPLVLSVDPGSAAPLQRGSVVDVYVNRVEPGASGSPESFVGPELTLRAVSVASLPQTSAGLGAGAAGGRAVQVMAPSPQIREVIAAVDLGARVTVVPVAGSPLRVEQ